MIHKTMAELRDVAARRILFAWLHEQVNADLYAEHGCPPPVPALPDEHYQDYLRQLLGLPPLHEAWSPATMRILQLGLIAWALIASIAVIVLLVVLAGYMEIFS